MEGVQSSSVAQKFGDQNRTKEGRNFKMKSVKMLSVVVIAVLLLAACGGGNSEPAAQVAKDYSGEVDMEVLVAQHYAAVQLLKAAEAAADSGQEVDMEVLTARRYQVQQLAEAIRIAQAGEP